MLEAEALECARGGRTLFRDVGFRLERGSLLRVAGENGSGKTSLLRIICGLALPVRGEVRWDGKNIRSLREEYWKHLVYVGHANALKDDLTQRKALDLVAESATPITVEQAQADGKLFTPVAEEA